MSKKPSQPDPTAADVAESTLSRRSFLNASAAAAATTLIAGCATGDRASAPAPMAAAPQPSAAPALRPLGLSGQRIRVGLIGCGYRGRGAAASPPQNSRNRLSQRGPVSPTPRERDP